MKYILENINSERILHLKKEVACTPFFISKKYLDFTIFAIESLAIFSVKSSIWGYQIVLGGMTHG